MAKEKKIGFRYFLQTNLKPQEENGIKCYPVYVMVSYAGKNTAFNFPLPYITMYLSDDDFESGFIKKQEPLIREQIESFEEHITKIIRFEIQVLGEEFTLKGLANRRTDYYRNLSSEVEKYLFARLIGEVWDDTKHEFEYSNYYFIWDIYSVLKEFTPNIQDLISTELKMMLIAYVIFVITNFEDLVLPEVGSVRLIDWLQEKIVMRYKDTILNFDGFDKHFINESINSPVWALINDIHIDKKEMFKYLNAINKSIVFCVK